jgi:hypothetical protein
LLSDRLNSSHSAHVGVHLCVKRCVMIQSFEPLCCKVCACCTAAVCNAVLLVFALVNPASGLLLEQQLQLSEDPDLCACWSPAHRLACALCWIIVECNKHITSSEELTVAGPCVSLTYKASLNNKQPTQLSWLCQWVFLHHGLPLFLRAWLSV